MIDFNSHKLICRKLNKQFMTCHETRNYIKQQFKLTPYGQKN